MRSENPPDGAQHLAEGAGGDEGTVEETADVVNVSPRMVKRDWSLAPAWLRRELSGSSA
jgi:hypothetical protein